MSRDIKVIDYGNGAFELVPGHTVVCDGCSQDWTDRKESGGIYGLMTKAYCPECAPRIEEDARRYGELEHIKLHCPPGKSFADWVREDLR